MRKIFISAGHSNKAGRDRGAVGNGYIEGELSVELRNLISNELKLLGNIPINDGDNTILYDSLNYFKNITSPNSIVLDIHWNAATPKAKGTETFVPINYSEYEYKLAKDISNTVSTILNTPIRGVDGVKEESESHHGRLGWMKLVGAKSIAKLLFEYSKEDIENNYIIVKGDTLSQIAKHNNTTVSKLVVLNNLTSSNKIYIGQIIKIK